MYLAKLCLVLSFSRFVLSELASSERDYVEKLEHCVEVSAAASHVTQFTCDVTLLPDHVTLLPDHVTFLSDHVTLLPDHVTFLPGHVISQNYAAAVDDPSAPKPLKALQNSLFANLSKIYNFHKQ